MTEGFERIKQQIAVALPPHISVDRFQSAVTTAVNLNPELLRADRRSLFNACTKAANDGLIPDGREGALVIFGKQAVWMPMVYGIIKKARQSGEIATLGARIIYQNELDTGRFKFSIVNGEDTLEHNPILFEERGAPVGAYARVKFKDGSIEYEILNKAELEKIRNVSRAKSSGPWVDWWEEMAKKSAIRRLAKRLPLSADLVATISHGDEATEYEQIKAAERARLINGAAAQLGAPRDEEGEFSDADQNTIDVGESVLAQEAEQEAHPLADMPDELLALANCVSVAGVERLEKEIGATIVGKGSQEQLVAWDEACAARIQQLIKGKK